MEGTSFCFSQRRTAWAVLISANQGDPWAANHLKNAHRSTVLVRELTHHKIQIFKFGISSTSKATPNVEQGCQNRISFACLL